MATAPTFTPPQQPGTALQVTAAAVLAASAGVCYYLAAQPAAQGGLAFLLLGLLLTAPLPLLLYGAYALRQAVYAVNRDRLVLQWGWWVEEIPMQAITWVQTADALETPLPLPRARWPGNLTGERQSGGLTYTFMASQPQGLVVIATEHRRYVISPTDPAAFLEAVRRAAEEGSLETVLSASHRPTRWLNAIWNDPLARALLLAAWGVTLAAVLWSSLAASSLAPSRGAPADDRAVLLAAAAVLFQGLNAGLGLFAYQSPLRRAMAYLIWLTGALAAAGFLASVGVVLLGGAG